MVGGRDGGKGHRLGRRKKKMRSYILRLIEIAYIVKKIVIAYTPSILKYMTLSYI